MWKSLDIHKNVWVHQQKKSNFDRGISRFASQGYIYMYVGYGTYQDICASYILSFPGLNKYIHRQHPRYESCNNAVVGDMALHIVCGVFYNITHTFPIKNSHHGRCRMSFHFSPIFQRDSRRKTRAIFWWSKNTTKRKGSLFSPFFKHDKASTRISYRFLCKGSKFLMIPLLYFLSLKQRDKRIQKKKLLSFLSFSHSSCLHQLLKCVAVNTNNVFFHWLTRALRKILILRNIIRGNGQNWQWIFFFSLKSS